MMAGLPPNGCFMVDLSCGGKDARLEYATAGLGANLGSRTLMLGWAAVPVSAQCWSG